jgi:hypothetical protein
MAVLFPFSKAAYYGSIISHTPKLGPGVLRELISRKSTSISVQIIIREGINLAFKMCDVDSKNYIVKLTVNISNTTHVFHTLSVERSAFFVRHHADMVRSNGLLL